MKEEVKRGRAEIFRKEGSENKRKRREMKKGSKAGKERELKCG